MESEWIEVSKRLPDDGVVVDVRLQRSNKVQVARRGHYESTGAWFDPATQCPIYDTITHWKPRPP